MKPFPALAFLSLILAGCGGSGGDDPVTGLILSQRTSDYNGNAAPLETVGEGLYGPDGAIVSFGSGARRLDLLIPSVEPGTYEIEPLGDGPGSTYASYNEPRTAGSAVWFTNTEGSVTISGTGTTRRFTFRNLRFDPLPDGIEGDLPSEGSFVLSGSAWARLEEDAGNVTPQARRKVARPTVR